MQKRLLDLIYLEKRPLVPRPGVGEQNGDERREGKRMPGGIDPYGERKSRIDKRCVGFFGSEVVKRTNRTLLARTFFFRGKGKELAKLL